MCEHCQNPSDTENAGTSTRRGILKAGAAFLAAPLVAGAGTSAQVASARAEPAPGPGPYTARAWGMKSANTPFEPMTITRRALGPTDILIDVLYASICHTDIHTARNEWPVLFPASYPCVPGHEIIGRVVAVGSKVSKFRVGDVAGVGCLVDADLSCENCLNDREQNCLGGATFTYNSPDPVSGGYTYGGYSDRIVVKEHFGIRIPPGADLAATTPLLCAGVTTFSPMQHWQLAASQKVGIIGLGGLGHIAVKLAAARKAEVTVFTTTPAKVADAKRLGARDAVLWSDTEGMKRLAGKLDLLISTVPTPYPMQPFMDVLKLDGTLINLGVMDQLEGLLGMAQAFGRKSLAGSFIGGIAETQAVIDYCTARNIKADIELIRPDQITAAFDRVKNKDVRYRFVIDMNTIRKTV